MNEYNELDWFLRKIEHEYARKIATDKLYNFEVLQMNEASKNKKNKSLVTKWRKDLVEVINTEYVEKIFTVFDRIKMSANSNKHTLFHKIAERANKT